MLFAGDDAGVEKAENFGNLVLLDIANAAHYLRHGVARNAKVLGQASLTSARHPI